MNLSRRGFLGSLFIVSVGAATATPAVIAELFAPLGTDLATSLAPVGYGMGTTFHMASLNALFKQVYSARILDLVPGHM